MCRMDDETTFLCAFSRQRRYGTTSNPNSQPQKIIEFVMHDVQPDDTIQGLALKYGSSMTEIKRVNRLWSNESLYLKCVIRIPIYADSVSPSKSNGSLPRSSSSSGGQSKPPHPVPAHRMSIDSTRQQEDTSLNDILSRIDQNIKNTAKNVRRMEKASNIESVVDMPSTSSSRQSMHNISFDRSPSPQIRRFNSSSKSKVVHKMDSNDHVYQL